MLLSLRCFRCETFFARLGKLKLSRLSTGFRAFELHLPTALTRFWINCHFHKLLKPFCTQPVPQVHEKGVRFSLEQICERGTHATTQPCQFDQQEQKTRAVSVAARLQRDFTAVEAKRSKAHTQTSAANGNEPVRAPTKPRKRPVNHNQILSECPAVRRSIRRSIGAVYG